MNSDRVMGEVRSLSPVQTVLPRGVFVRRPVLVPEHTAPVERPETPAQAYLTTPEGPSRAQMARAAVDGIFATVLQGFECSSSSTPSSSPAARAHVPRLNIPAVTGPLATAEVFTPPMVVVQHPAQTPPTPVADLNDRTDSGKPLLGRSKLPREGPGNSRSFPCLFSEDDASQVDQDPVTALPPVAMMDTRAKCFTTATNKPCLSRLMLGECATWGAGSPIR